MIGTRCKHGCLYHLEIGASSVACVSSTSLRDLHHRLVILPCKF